MKSEFEGLHFSEDPEQARLTAGRNLVEVLQRRLAEIARDPFYPRDPVEARLVELFAEAVAPTVRRLFHTIPLP